MPQGRELTRGEEGLCARVFRNSINAANIEVVKRPKTMKFGGFTPYARINMDGATYKDDYIGEHLATPPDVGAAHHFLHEMAHSWQHLVGMPMLRLSLQSDRKAKALVKSSGKVKTEDTLYAAEYSYNIAASQPDLLDYPMEQQCDIIADYFGWKLWARKIPPNPWGHKIAGIAQLRAVLTKFLADPSYPRWRNLLTRARAQYRNEER